MSKNPLHDRLRQNEPPELLLPRRLGEHPACAYCAAPLADEHVASLEFRGLLQVIAGAAAHDIVDVAYACPCGGVNYVRFRREEHE